MKFSFRLQSLQNWKESLEEEARMSLARKMNRMKRVEEDIQELASQREENDRGLLNRTRKGLLARDYLIHKEFNEESYQDLAEMEMKKKEAEQEVREERGRLMGLMKERKILQRLREKRFETFLRELKKAEQKNLDEVAVGAYRRGVRLIGNTEGDS